MIQSCQQFCVIGPVNLTNFESLLERLKALYQNYTEQDFKIFISDNNKKLGFQDSRLLFNVRLDYFWAGVPQFMLKCMIEDSNLLSSTFNMLNSSINGIVEVTKYQAFLILCHMFCGTFPRQLGTKTECFGALMTEFNDEFQRAPEDELKLRLNKLKAIIRYFCVMHSRHERYHPIKAFADIIVFQRHKYLINQNNIIENPSILSGVQIKEGKFYKNERNQATFNPCSDLFVGESAFFHSLTTEDKIFFAHPELFILKILQNQPLQPNETIIVTGAEKYSEDSLLSKEKKYDFSVPYKDEAKFNQLLSVKETSFIFYEEKYYNAEEQHLYFEQQNLLDLLMKLTAGLEGIRSFQKSKESIVSGKIRKVTLNTEVYWELQFMVEWISISLMNWKKLIFYVDSLPEIINLNILVRELRNYTIKDLFEIIKRYVSFREEEKIKIGLIDYIKEFIL